MPDPLARDIVAMLLRRARADYRHVQAARANLASVGPRCSDLARATSNWCTSSGCAETARRMLYGTPL